MDIRVKRALIIPEKAANCN